MIPQPRNLVGTWRRFGAAGPVYEIIDVGREAPDGDQIMRVRVIESGEEADYKSSDILDDPRERCCSRLRPTWWSLTRPRTIRRACLKPMQILARRWQILTSCGCKAVSLLRSETTLENPYFRRRVEAHRRRLYPFA